MIKIRQALAAAGAALTMAALAGATPTNAQTLKAVKARGVLNCGVSEGIPGFSAPDASGNWSGIDVDFCRAIAAAVFNDAKKVKFFPSAAPDRFKMLQARSVDLLSRNTTWTMSREVELKLAFAATTYYDGQGFMLRPSLNISSALEFGQNKKICVQTETTTEANLADFFKTNNMTYVRMAFKSLGEAVKAYESGQCDAFTADVSALYAERSKLAKPEDHVILPDVISKEPLGPAVRQGDEQWFHLVRWVHFAMLNAEELGVGSKTIDAAKQSTKPEVKRLVGTEGNYGEQLGLTRDWAARIVAQVGNYGEVFERNVGTATKLGIPRGENNLWNRGGIQYAPPIR
jgi:general L-amino acid transport system substrate-binding protein